MPFLFYFHFSIFFRPRRDGKNFLIFQYGVVFARRYLPNSDGVMGSRRPWEKNGIDAPRPWKREDFSRPRFDLPKLFLSQDGSAEFRVRVRGDNSAEKSYSN